MADITLSHAPQGVSLSQSAFPRLVPKQQWTEQTGRAAMVNTSGGGGTPTMTSSSRGQRRQAVAAS